MHVGANWPYDMWDGEEIGNTLSKLLAMEATEVTVMSHQLTNRLAAAFSIIGIEVIHIRAKTGPQNRGTYPSYILDYAEWPGENTLRDAITACGNAGIRPRVVLGNEPDIEMAERPETSDWWIYEAEEYRKWYETEVVNIRSAFGDTVLCSPAPLSQGWHDRFLTWYNVLSPVYNSSLVDFMAEHNYQGEPSIEWNDRWTYYIGYGKEIHILEYNNNGIGPRNYGGARLYYENQGIWALSYFTLEGGANTRENRPNWWFLNDSEIAMIRDSIHRREEEPSVMNIYDGFLQLWYAENSNVNPFVGEDFSGIFKAWSRDPKQYGSPVANEFTTDDGRTIQAFATGVYEWKNGGLEKVESGL